MHIPDHRGATAQQLRDRHARLSDGAAALVGAARSKSRRRHRQAAGGILLPVSAGAEVALHLQEHAMLDAHSSLDALLHLDLELQEMLPQSMHRVAVSRLML